MTHEERTEFIQEIRQQIREEVPRVLQEMGDSGQLGRWANAAMGDRQVRDAVRERIADEVASRVTVHIAIQAEPKQSLSLKCEACGTADRLQIHHKDRDVTNHVLSNLSTLCESCLKVETQG